MFESFLNRNPYKDAKKPEISESSKEFEDRKIKAEIDEIGENYYKKIDDEIESKFNVLTNSSKREKHQAPLLTNFINECLDRYKNQINEEMNIQEFVDFLIDKEKKVFQIKSMIEEWIASYKELGGETSLRDFFDFVSKKGAEAEFLLDPGPELSKEDLDKIKEY